MIKHIKQWYIGKEVIVDDEAGPNECVGVISQTTTERHLTAKLARRLVVFYLDQWKWIVGAVIVPIFGALIAIKFFL